MGNGLVCDAAAFTHLKQLKTKIDERAHIWQNITRSPGSSNGRTLAFGAGYLGSNPSPGARIKFFMLGGKKLVLILLIGGAVLAAGFFKWRASSASEYLVERVVDGDTFVVRQNGRTEKVRLIGVDTPETVDPRRPVQCFGKEASDYAKHLLTGKLVKLYRDQLGDDRDKYDRLLRYVFLSSAQQNATSTFVNLDLLEKGYAFAYTQFNFEFKSDFVAAERMAHRGGVGLWATSTCAGKHR